MATTYPGAVRNKLIQSLDEIVQEEAPWILGYFVRVNTLAHPWVRNYRQNEMITNYIKYLNLVPHP